MKGASRYCLDNDTMSVRCLLMMGGTGSRFGADIPKQYTNINGVPLFTYILKRIMDIDYIETICIVAHKEWVDYVTDQINQTFTDTDKIIVTIGGNTRSESVKNGLNRLSIISDRNDVILIHDATHPYVDERGTDLVVKAVNEYGGATLGACQYDTCYRMNEEGFIEEIIPRQFLVSGASPEAFKFGLIYEIYSNATSDELDNMTSAGAIASAHNIRMKVIPSNVLNLKITYPGDMEIFKLLAKDYFFKEI